MRTAYGGKNHGDSGSFLLSKLSPGDYAGLLHTVDRELIVHEAAQLAGAAGRMGAADQDEHRHAGCEPQGDAPRAPAASLQRFWRSLLLDVTETTMRQA